MCQSMLSTLQFSHFMLIALGARCFPISILQMEEQVRQLAQGHKLVSEVGLELVFLTPGPGI